MTSPKREGEKPIPSAVPRESDNPIVEEFKEELLYRPASGTRPIGAAAVDAEKMARLEGLLFDLHQKVEALERRVEILERRT